MGANVALFTEAMHLFCRKFSHRSFTLTCTCRLIPFGGRKQS
ncbi:hypothetical protein HMPREF1554_00365 [Porphyromonas gingivalis F0569]|nr:hypothetical protein HMPREF1554_00365 [Porphyromonas gingivalis F0569]